MRRISTATGDSGAQTSPGTPEHGDNNNYGEEGISRGWSSERVQSPAASNIRRQISPAALMPFNSGRAPPSKWDDAERWITSPVSGIGSSNNNNNSALQTQKKPKSKSGPLGPPGVMYNNTPNYSPSSMAVLGGGNGNGKYFMAGSPLTTGVLVPDGLSIRYAVDNGMNYNDNAITLSTNSPGSSDLFSKMSSLTNNGAIEVESAVSRVVSRRDMATQMSPEGSSRSSYSIPPPSGESAVDLLQRNCSSFIDVRDVQVDKGVTITRLSKKQCQRKKMKKKSSEVKDLACPWVGGASKTSKLQREEAKITAWENLQKAKAEASIRKLEVKLEKERSASMDKILNKFKTAQMKAEATRRSITDNSQVHQSSKNSPKMFLSKYIKTSPLFSCCCFFRHST